MTDEQLMDCVAQDDLDKAAILFERYSATLLNFFTKMTYDRTDSEDLTQNLFVRLLKYRHTYRTGANFRAWIFQMARNVFYDEIEKNRKMPTDEIKEYDQKMVAEPENIEKNEELEILNKALAQLPTDQREILWLNRYENMTYNEIAKITDSTESAIKMKAHRALKNLKEIYFRIEGRS